MSSKQTMVYRQTLSSPSDVYGGCSRRAIKLVYDEKCGMAAVGVCFFLLYRIKLEEIFTNKSQSKQSRLYYLWKAEYRLLQKHCVLLILEIPTTNAFSTNSKNDNWIFVGSPRGGKSYSWEESSGLSRFPTTLICLSSNPQGGC